MTSASPATVFLGICAILFGLASAYGVRAAMTGEEAPPAPSVSAPVKQEVPERKIILAKNNIPPNVMIKTDHLHVYSVSEARFRELEGAISRPEILLGRVTSRIIRAGTAITEADVYELGKVPTLQDKLKEGETALTIPVDVTSSIAGYLQPELFVNISLTVTGDKHPELKNLTTVTLLKNVRILATSENLFGYNPGIAKDMSNITVAVTPEVANKLIVAQKYGTLSVTMTNAADAEAGLSDNGPEETIAPLDLFGLEDTPSIKSAAKSDLWYSASKRTIMFDDAEVKESRSATAGDDDTDDVLGDSLTSQVPTKSRTALLSLPVETIGM